MHTPARALVAVATSLGVLLILGPLLAASAPTPLYAASSNLSIDATQRFQQIDGFGVNANPKNWNFSNLSPAIDRLVDDMHASIWRVDIFGQSDWIDDPSHLTPSYYSVIYETPDFQSLWRTLAYLNGKGARVVLSASGLVPAWMGGTVINTANEDQWVEMITSVVDYGRRVKHIPISMLSPLNESDLGAPEGATVWQVQQARLMSKLLVRLQALGYGDVELIAPEVSRVNNAPVFIDTMMDDPLTMAHIHHFAAHDYSGSTGGLADYLATSAYPDRNLWMTEWSQNATDGWLDSGRVVADEWRFASVMTDDLLSLLDGGASAVLAWDAWDNVHEHCGCTDISRWGQLALDSTTQTYSPKKRYFTNAQVFKFVPSGWVRIRASATDPALRVESFTNGTSDQVTIVGHNTGAASATLNGSLAGLAAIPGLHWYETNAAEDLVRKADVAVVGTGFSVTIPADSFFTLTSLVDAASGPTPTPTPTLASTALPTLTPVSGLQTILFDDLADPNRPLTGVYDSTDWGTGAWYLSSQYGHFGTNSVSFNGPALVTAQLTFPVARRLVQLDAYNGGSAASTISLSCNGLPTVSYSLAAGALATIPTNWSSTCSAATIGSTNGWYTNFDNLVLATTGSAATATSVATRTVAPTSTPTATRTAVPTSTPVATGTATRTPAPTATPTPTPPPTATPTPNVAVAGTRTLSFDDLVNPNRSLTGQYPSGVVDWGSTAWYLSGPYTPFSTQSISFNGPTLTSAAFSFVDVTPHQLVQIDAANGGTTASTISLSCAGQPTRQFVLAAGQQSLLVTGWGGTCTSITISSTNGWNTNFDSLMLH